MDPGLEWVAQPTGGKFLEHRALPPLHRPRRSLSRAVHGPLRDGAAAGTGPSGGFNPSSHGARVGF